MVFPDLTRKLLIAGKKEIMNKHRMTTMVAAVAFAGCVHALAAQENIDTAPVDNTSQQNTSEQKPPTETPAPVATTPVQAIARPDDKLLSEMKVYPSF
jgi:glucose/arabinose dehydrogenase